MDDEDYNNLFSALSAVMREKEMDWVIDQVNEQIRLGKTKTKEISPQDEGYRQIALPAVMKSRATSGRKLRKEEFLITAEYSPKERLLLLIDAIEQAVVNTNTMVHDTLEFTRKEFGIDQITFYSVENQRSKTFSGTEFEVKDEDVRHLKSLLTELRTKVNAD